MLFQPAKLPGMPFLLKEELGWRLQTAGGLILYTLLEHVPQKEIDLYNKPLNFPQNP